MNPTPQSDAESSQTASGAHDSAPLAFDESTGPVDIQWIDLPGLLALWILAFIVFLQFFTRYVLNDSLAWTEEIARYVLILVAYLGAITVTRKGTHIFLEFFYRYLPALLAKWLSVCMELCSMVFWGYLAYIAVELAQKTRTKMASAEIPKSLLYWAVAIALGIMAVYSLIWLVKKIRTPADTVLHDIEQQALADK